MEPVLTVFKDNKQAARVEVTRGGFKIGRKKTGCDLQLEEDLASREHAEIVCEGGLFWIRDLGSMNGTYINGAKLTGRHQLSDGDQIGIGSTRLKFAWDQDEEKTRPASGVGRPQGDKADQGNTGKKDKGPLRVTLRIAKGPFQGKVFQNWESPLRIGKDLNKNEVVLPDPAVSNQHAQIVQEGEGYLLEDLGSTNGTFLDGVKLPPNRREHLSNGREINIGGAATLVFELVDLQKRRRNLLVALVCALAVAVGALVFKQLQPPDIAGLRLQTGHDWEQRGELQKALEEYQTALKIEPTRVEAQRGVTRIKAELEAAETLKRAEAAAEAEQFDQAKELVHQILREFPTQKRALELEDVIKTIENAKIALTAKNWGDAVRLLEKAREKYPKSKVIGAQLEKARKELSAQIILAKAKDALQHQQADMAGDWLRQIPDTSAYFTEARQYLDRLDQDRKTRQALTQAQTLYREGRLTDALTQIGLGLGATPTNAALLKLRDHVREMVERAGALETAEAIKPENGVDTLLKGLKPCDDVLSAEADPLNVLRIRAQETRAHITQWLHDLSKSYATKAQQLLDAGDRKEALRSLEFAVKADANNQAAQQTANGVRKQVVVECKKFYLDGIALEDLGSGPEKKLAQEKFKKVLEIGLPGFAPPDDYYEKAARKLKQSLP